MNWQPGDHGVQRRAQPEPVDPVSVPPTRPDENPEHIGVFAYQRHGGSGSTPDSDDGQPYGREASGGAVRSPGFQLPQEGSIGGPERTAGGFRGRGPQGYRRSDARLSEEIHQRLTDDPDVDAREISVQVRNGVATLGGSVADRRSRQRIEDLVDECAGVEDIHNRIRVDAGPRPAADDGAVRHRDEVDAAPARSPFGPRGLR